MRPPPRSLKGGEHSQIVGGRRRWRLVFAAASSYPPRAMIRLSFPRALSRTLPLLRAAAVALAVLAAVSCSNEENRLAKQRIFSPEDPPSDRRRAEEALALEQAAQDAALWRRLWRMDRQEVFLRAGAHRAESDVAFRWTRGKRTVSLKEEHRFTVDRAGNFHARIFNEEDQGLEFVWADGQAFAKGRYGAFRPRRIDRAQQDRWRDEATSALRTTFDLFGGRLRAKPLGAQEQAGGTVLRFAPVLGERWGAVEPPARLPPVAYGLFRAPGEEKPRPGPDADTGRRLEFDARVEPIDVSGELAADPRTGVILRARLQATFRVPGDEEGPAELALTVSYSLHPDEAVAVAAPAGAVPSRTVHAVTDPLWFLGEPKAPAAAPATSELPDEGE